MNVHVTKLRLCAIRCELSDIEFSLAALIFHRVVSSNEWPETAQCSLVGACLLLIVKICNKMETIRDVVNVLSLSYGHELPTKPLPDELKTYSETEDEQSKTKELIDQIKRAERFALRFLRFQLPSLTTTQTAHSYACHYVAALARYHPRKLDWPLLMRLVHSVCTDFYHSTELVIGFTAEQLSIAALFICVKSVEGGESKLWTLCEEVFVSDEDESETLAHIIDLSTKLYSDS